MVKFARSVGGKAKTIKDFFLSLLLMYSGEAIDKQLPEPYQGGLAELSATFLDAFIQEREVLEGAVRDLDANVNPSFVCEDVVRTIRRIRKQAARQSTS